MEGQFLKKNYASFLYISGLVRAVFWVFDSPLCTRYVVIITHKVFLWTTKAQWQTRNKTNPTKVCRARGLIWLKKKKRKEIKI